MKRHAAANRHTSRNNLFFKLLSPIQWTEAVATTESDACRLFVSSHEQRCLSIQGPQGSENWRHSPVEVMTMLRPSFLLAPKGRTGARFTLRNAAPARIFAALGFAGNCLGSAALAAVIAATAYAADLPVREVILYKHGVAYFER